MTVPSMTNTAVGKHRVDFFSPQMHVQHENPCCPFPEEDVGMNIFPRPHVTEHSIGLSPSASPNYVSSSLPYPTVPSSPDRWIPRICHGVERRQCSRPSSRAAEPYPKRTRGERTAIKTASSRRWDAAEDAHQIPSSSLWVAPRPAPKVHTKYPPTPTIISHEHSPSVGLRGAYGSLGERDVSPGFDGDIESSDVARRSQRARAGAKERLTIVVPGGKSEAYVAMAFERSCSLTDGDHADHHGSYTFPTTLSPPRERQPPREEKRVRRTGLKIRIPAPNPLLLLSLRLADSCRITGIDMDTAGDSSSSGEYSGACTSPELECTSSCSSTRGVGSDVLQGPLCSALAHIPTLEGRIARRVAHRTALAPYAIDHSRARSTVHRHLIH
ncbi:hypothetical protein BJY52DRAFT_1220457 [Lactarius psammicola]|nr:hypothetical protein BJY52DRAFT_1220457 [Lactarius psammicola]